MTHSRGCRRRGSTRRAPRSPAWPSGIRRARSCSSPTPTPARTGSTRPCRSSATRCPGVERNVCSEVIELRLLGTRAKAPASIVEPLLISDLPVFLRWRGEPPWGAPELEQLVDLTDRLIVDSTEWDDLPYPYRHLARALRPHRGLRHRVGAHVALAHAARVALARDRRRAHDPRARHGGAGASCSPAGCARGSSATTSRSSTSRRSASRASSSTASPRRSRRATRRSRATCSPTSSTASPATAVYEAAVRATIPGSKEIGAPRASYVVDDSTSSKLLYRARLPEFRRVAAAIAGDRELGCDAVQEAFATAVRKRALLPRRPARSRRGSGGSSSTLRATRAAGGPAHRELT